MKMCACGLGRPSIGYTIPHPVTAENPRGESDCEIAPFFPAYHDQVGGTPAGLPSLLPRVFCRMADANSFELLIGLLRCAANVSASPMRSPSKAATAHDAAIPHAPMPRGPSNSLLTGSSTMTGTAASGAAPGRPEAASDRWGGHGHDPFIFRSPSRDEFAGGQRVPPGEMATPLLAESLLWNAVVTLGELRFQPLLVATMVMVRKSISLAGSRNLFAKLRVSKPCSRKSGIVITFVQP
jgi:hypothetical protein